MIEVAHHCSWLQWLCLSHVIVATHGKQNRLAVIAAHNTVDCASNRHPLQSNMATSVHKQNMGTTNLSQNTQVWQIGAPSDLSKSDRLECTAIGHQWRLCLSRQQKAESQAGIEPLTCKASGRPVCMAMRTRRPLNSNTLDATKSGVCSSLASA